MVPYRNRLVSTICMSVLAVFLLTFHLAAADAPRPAKERGDVREDRKQEVCGRVGQIFIFGNTVTRDSVILEQVPLFPGHVFTLADLRVAERNLARLKLFKDDPPPRVRIIDDDNDNGGDRIFKDIRVDVSERDGNVYYWAIVDTLDFVTTRAVLGLPAAIFLAEGFPRELIDLVREGKITEVPAFLRDKFRNAEEIGCTGIASPPAIVP